MSCYGYTPFPAPMPSSPPGLHPYCLSPLSHCSTQCKSGPPTDDVDRPLLLIFFTQVMFDDTSVCEISCLIAIVEPLLRAASVCGLVFRMIHLVCGQHRGFFFSLNVPFWLSKSMFTSNNAHLFLLRKKKDFWSMKAIKVGRSKPTNVLQLNFVKLAVETSWKSRDPEWHHGCREGAGGVVRWPSRAAIKGSCWWFNEGAGDVAPRRKPMAT